jgi:hypothetical protein
MGIGGIYVLLKHILFFLPIQVNIVKNLNYTIILCLDWNKDWKPGPYPKTPEERASAAKKYGMRLEDYEPFPDDGLGKGDYPDLPLVSGDSKDRWENWDMPHLKRNFGEPVSRGTRRFVSVQVHQHIHVILSLIRREF